MNNPNLPTDPRSQMSAAEYEAEYYTNRYLEYDDDAEDDDEEEDATDE